MRKSFKGSEKFRKKYGKRHAEVMFWQPQRSYEFGPFRVDTRERQLLRNGEVVPLRPKVFDILLMLVQNSGHVLTKDDVMKHVWSDAAVEEGNIARNISTLRTALGEHPREHRYIETIPWRGYRFVATVKERRGNQAGFAIDSIAVLPFVNATADRRNEYISDGITESLITSLAQSTNLRVTSRYSAFRYKGREFDARQVGHELKVQAVLMGRVAVADDLLSISVELVDTSEDRHIWGAQYIRNPTDLFAVHDEIARRIAEMVRLRLPEHEPRRRHPQNHEAYLCYLKGRYYFNKLTPDSVHKGIEYLQQAIVLDQEYALAYAGLADCHNYLAHRDEAKNAVLKALELDEALGEAHASLGFFRFLYDWDFAGAQKEFEYALALCPNYAEAHHWYAIYLANLGRHEEADQEAQKAVELDPLSLLMNMTHALNFYLARQHDKAVDQLQRIMEMEPNFAVARSVMGNVLVQKGLYEEAMAEFEKVLELIKGSAGAEISVKTLMAHAFARRGKQGAARKLLEEVTSTGSASAYSIAGVYAALGKSDPAFDWLNKAYAQRDLQLVSLKVDPTLDGVRRDLRFKELIRRVGIPE